MEKTINEQLQDSVTAYGLESCLAAAHSLKGEPGPVAPTEVKVTIEAGAATATLTELAQRLDLTLKNTAQNVFSVVDRLEKLQASKAKGVPAEYLRILAPESLDYTLTALDSAVTSQLAAGDKREAAYRDRSDLVKRRVQIETAIKLTEAEAIMDIEGTGKDAYVFVDGKKVYMPNDTARDAYRRTVSKADREELATVNGVIAAIDADIARASVGWDTAKEASDTLRARANVQAALLNFLASRG